MDGRSDAPRLLVQTMESAEEIDNRSKKSGKMRRDDRFRSGRGRRDRFVNWRGTEHPPPTDFSPLTPEGELELLKQRVKIISRRLEEIRQKIGDQKGIGSQRFRGEATAVVDEEECTGCGLCYEVCPVGAIAVEGLAKIDTKKCIACLACVKRCPQGAIAIKYPDR